MEFAISKPVTNGDFTYSTRDSGGAWSPELAMNRGVNEPTKNFVSPVCDELRITGTLAASEPINRCHLAGLSISSGLSFDLTVGATNQAYAQTSYARPKPTHRQTLRIAETDDVNIVLIITGINQQQLNFRQIAFAQTSWIPDFCYSRGASQSAFNSHESITTGGSNYLSLQSSLHSETFPFDLVSNDKWLDLEHLVDDVLLDGYCLIEKNTTSDDYIDSYLARITIDQVTNDFYDRNSLTINASEAFQQ